MFDTPDIVSGLAGRGYHTICIGGVGFFNKTSPLGGVLPSLFAESHWHDGIGVTSPTSTEQQVALAQQRLGALPADKRAFLFINVSALHQPNCYYRARRQRTTAAKPWRRRWHMSTRICHASSQPWRGGRRLLAILCSDHGTAYGDDGYHGHRLAHPCVFEVPYAEFTVARGSGS